MNGMEASAFQPMFDYGASQTQREELAPSHNAVLDLSELPHRRMKVSGRHSDPKAAIE
jgi:hypothetical protein